MALALHRTFTDHGDFAACDRAEGYLDAAGFSLGDMQAGSPRGILFGEFDIQKWRNLSADDRAALHGIMTGDMRQGPVTIWIFESAPEEAKAALLRIPRVSPEVAVPLRVVVEAADGARLWERGSGEGVTAASYRADGTLAAIVAALEDALRQARAELGADDAHPVADVGTAPAEIERDVPPAVVRRGDPGR